MCKNQDQGNGRSGNKDNHIDKRSTNMLQQKKLEIKIPIDFCITYSGRIKNNKQVRRPD